VTRSDLRGGAEELGLGKFIYEGSVSVDFDDRLLYHLQTVIGSKLRRSESFFFSWKNDPSLGEGRITVWLHVGTTMAFRYYGSRVPQLNRQWLEALVYTANSPTGLHVVPEPPDSGSGGAGAESSGHPPTELHIA
jgi:hypothetical protein